MSNKILLRFLWDKIRVHKNWVFASLIFAILAALTKVLMASLVPKFINEALTPKLWGKVIEFSFLALGIIVVDGLANFLHRVLIRTATERTVRDIRDHLFGRFLVFSESKMSKFSSGKAVNSVVTDSMVIGLGLQVGADLIQQPLIIIGLFAYLFKLNWQLTLFCMFAVGPVAYIGKILGGSARRNQGRIQQSLEDVSKHIIDTMGGLRTAHSFNITPFLKGEYQGLTQKAYNFLIRLCRVEEMVSPLSHLVAGFAGAALIAFGGYLIIINKTMEVGDLIGFITAAGLIQQPLKQLNQMNIRIQQVLAATQRVYEIMNEDLDQLSRDQELVLIQHESLNQKPDIIPRVLEFKNVCFSYPVHNGLSRAVALSDVSFSLSPGQKLALVGRSGSGKSTLSLLSMRFLDPVSGQVLLDGKPASQWSLAAYREHFSYVSQDVYLFNRSLRDNLKIAKANASESEMIEALRKANIWDFVEALPEKLDTVLYERASNFSGGEKQRLAIARAFLKNSPILVLDEATSQLDSHNETVVQAALKELMQDRGVLVIAHRLSTIREADQVLVMEQGRIIECGVPQQLLSKDQGAFAELWRKQQSI
ncbi:MAG: ABC transporter ATP-binding protein [Proteobacteria bacterium]|nr:ABC transporter ATP-binding protein [Pseudomonadota bacterium]